MPTRAVGVGLVRGDRGRGLGDAAGGGGDASAAGVLARGGERGALDGEVRRGERARRAAAARERVRARAARIGVAHPREKYLQDDDARGGRARDERARRAPSRANGRATDPASDGGRVGVGAARRAPRGVRSRGTREGKGEGSRGRRSSLARLRHDLRLEYRRRARDLALFRRRTQKNRAVRRDASPVTTATVRIPRIPSRARVALLSSAIGSTPNPSAPRPTRRSVDGASNRAGLVGGQVDGRFYPPQPPRRRFPPGRDPPPSLRTARVFAPMATETMSAAPKRRAFVLKARARPALASLTAGAGFTRADLAASPMPAIGDVAAEKSKLSFGDIMKKASQRAFRGGAAGFAAGVVQVRDRRAFRRATPPPPLAASPNPLLIARAYALQKSRFAASPPLPPAVSQPPPLRPPRVPPTPTSTDAPPTDALLTDTTLLPFLPRASRVHPPAPPSYPRTAHNLSLKRNKNRWVRSCGSVRP
jgi:hypothetical protein